MFVRADKVLYVITVLDPLNICYVHFVYACSIRMRIYLDLCLIYKHSLVLLLLLPTALVSR